MCRGFLLSWRLRSAAVVFLLFPVGFLVSAFWRANLVAKRSAVEVAALGRSAFETIALDSGRASAFEQISASPGFRDIVEFQGELAISAQEGLFMYDVNGILRRRYRCGAELPPGRLGALATGIAAGYGAPVLAIATEDSGLLLFDGKRFREVLPKEQSLRSIASVRVLRSGRILLGTKHGLHVYDGKTILTVFPQVAAEHITALAGEEGDLWIGTLQHGVFHERGGHLEDLGKALPDPHVLSLVHAGNEAFVGTPLGVVAFHDGQKQRVLAEGYFARALDAEHAQLWVGTQDEGIVRVPLNETARRISLGSGASQESIEKIVTLRGEPYALSSRAVSRFDPSRNGWIAVLQAEKTVLADRNVSALGWSGGRLWVGYFDHGLDVLEAGLDRAVHKEDDRLFCVNRIADDSAQRRTAVATANGLLMFDASGSQRQWIGRKDGLLSDHVTDVAFDHRAMTVATPAGLSIVDDAGVRSLYAFHGLVNNHVYTVASNGKQTLAGTLGGLSLLDQDRVLANYTTSNSKLQHNWITALVLVGDEWFAGTYGAGVMRMDREGQWHGFPDFKEGFVVNPNAMLASGGAVYAGTLDRGLYIYETSTMRWTRVQAGLPSLNVTSIAVNGSQVFIGTDNGLVRASREAIR